MTHTRQEAHSRIAVTPGALQRVGEAIEASVLYAESIQSIENRQRLQKTLRALDDVATFLSGPVSDELARLQDENTRMRDALTKGRPLVKREAEAGPCPACDPGNEGAAIYGDLLSEFDAVLTTKAG